MATVRTTFQRSFADDTPKLTRDIARLLDAEAIGLDVEMGQRLKRLPGGVTKGEQILALIQIAGDDLSLVVDPLRITDLQPLAPLMKSKALKVVLGGATDIQLLEEHGLQVHNVVDLGEVAISVFGHKEEGMRALAARALDIHIDKSIRREDWLRRPINPAMLSYAHRDAELTLRLYHWFQHEHPAALAAHIRHRFHPSLPAETPEWIRQYLTRRVDAARLLKELRIDPSTQTNRLVRDVRLVESFDLSPGQQRRLLRLIGELSLTDLFDEVVPYASSPSAVFRASAARTLGRLKDERARPHLERLGQDDLEDVTAAAEQGLRELDAAKAPAIAATVDDSEVPAALKPEALKALEQLRSSLLPSEEPDSGAETA